jgi:hypothetical protein
VKDDIDMQKKYPQEHKMLKSYGVLKRPVIPSYDNEGKEITGDQKKAYAETYWSEYIRAMEDKTGELTKERFDELKKNVVRTKPSASTPWEKETTELEDIALQAAEQAKSIADSEIQYNR